MVAPYEIGEPVRSYVLLPGTGIDKVAKPLCLDLASTSSVAGTISVQSTIPHAVPVGNLTPSSQEKKDAIQEEEKQDEKKQLQDLNGDIASGPPIQGRQNGGMQQAATPVPAGVKRSLNDEAASEEEKRGASPPPAKIMKAGAQAAGSTGTPTTEVEALRRKCAELQNQNKNLNRRLAMFHDLFRSKERLANFVKFLDTTS